MALLGLKILLTSLMTARMTLIARSRGARIAGVVLGLPLTSAPVSVFLAVENGAAFSARAAVGTLTGVVGIQLFCAAYALCARRRSWAWALLGGAAACVSAVALLQRVPFGLGAAVAVPLLGAVLVRAALERVGLPERASAGAPGSAPGGPPRWDLPLRAVVSTALVVVVTGSARLLGPGWSGALSALPVITAVLAAFAQHQAGRHAAITMLESAVTGTLGTVAFFGVVGGLLAPGTLLLTYLAATAAAVTLTSALARLSSDRARDCAPAAPR